MKCSLINMWNDVCKKEATWQKHTLWSSAKKASYKEETTSSVQVMSSLQHHAFVSYLFNRISLTPGKPVRDLISLPIDSIMQCAITSCSWRNAIPATTVRIDSSDSGKAFPPVLNSHRSSGQLHEDDELEAFLRLLGVQCGICKKTWTWVEDLRSRKKNWRDNADWRTREAKKPITVPGEWSASNSLNTANGKFPSSLGSVNVLDNFVKPATASQQQSAIRQSR